MSRLRKMKNHRRPVQHLCDELIVEIFTRLPSKTLLRCRSLSKSWYSCIGSPDFIRMQTFRSRQKLLIRHRSFKENEEDEFEGFYTLHPQDQLPLCPTLGYIGITQVQFPSSYSVIVGSCNGIFCLFDYRDYCISLWNPSIRRKLTLPDCPRRCYSEKEIAFGFDPVTDDYKIVTIPRCNDENVESSFVYTMKTDAWCAIASPMPLFVSVITKACAVNGAMYWWVQPGAGSYSYLLTFDLSTHVFGSIAVPDIDCHTLVPTTIKGSLGVMTADRAFTNWIWVRRDASWSLLFKLRLNQVQDIVNGVLQLGTNGDFVFDTNSRGFQVYNPKIRACSRLADFSTAFFLLDIVQCVESLQLLDIGTACE